MDSKTETVSDNELIAEFMGGKMYDDGTWRIPGKAKHVAYYELVMYEYSWDWIMPVWIKFRDLDLDLDGKYGKWIDSLQWYLFSSNEPKRFAERLAYAIKWYNSQSPDTIK